MKIITKTYRWEDSPGYERKFAIKKRVFCGKYVVESFIRIPLLESYDGINYLEANPHVLYRGDSEEEADKVIAAQKNEDYHGIILENGMHKILAN